MGSPPRSLLVALGAVGLLACGGNQFDSQGSRVSGDPDGSTPDAGSSDGGRAAGAGGRAGSGGSPGGAPSSGGAPNGGSPSSGGQPAGSGGGGTGGGTVLRASDFDGTCTFDHDCKLVTEGDVCGCPGCPNAAIAASAADGWERARSAISCQSPPLPCPEILCVEALAACVDGRCMARPALYIDPAHYDAACRESADCRIIQPGEVCSACRCGGAAVNTGAYQDYLDDIAKVLCTPGPSPCDCATIDVAHCEVSSAGALGTCMPGP